MAYSSLFRWFSGSLAALAGVVLCGLVLINWDSRPDSASRFNLIVLTVESFRADMVSEALTPRLLALVEEHDGVYFPQHRSVSAWTVPNIVALLSGTHPVRQGIVTRGQSLSEEPQNHLTARDGMGFSVSSIQPFALIDSYDGLGLVREPGGELPLTLAELARGNEVRGIWYHYLDTHLPHRPTLADGSQPAPDEERFDASLGLAPPSDAAEASRRRIVATQPNVPVEQVVFKPSDRMWIEAYYKSEIRAFDRWFEGIFDIFVRAGLIRNTVLVVTADHGEELGEEGRVGHASTTREAVLNDAVLNVPMIVWTPSEDHREALQAWVSSGVPTDHVDVGGTLPFLVGGTSAARPDDAIPVPLRPRNLVGPVLDSPRYAFTSAAGFAEPDPSRTSYFLLSREGTHGRRAIAKLSGELIPLDGDSVAPDLSALARLIILPRPQGEIGERGSPETAISWVWPRQSGEIAFTSIRERSRIEWSGVRDGQYILEYSAGTGGLQINGYIEVDGNGYTFGDIDREYWDTFVVPYGLVRLRVHEVQSRSASEWLTIRLRQ